MSENHEPVEVDRLTESEQLSGLPSDGHDELIELDAALDADADADADVDEEEGDETSLLIDEEPS